MEDLRLRMTGAQRRGPHWTAAKDIMLLLAVVCLGASAVYWWGVQSELIPQRKLIAGTFTVILVLAPPTLTSFLVPWSPGGMLLQKVNGRTWGQLAVVCAAIYLAYYSFQIQFAWWAAQQAVAESGLIYQQVFVGLIGFILIPALLWTPVSSEELEEKLKQAQLVKRYELQTQADIAILQATLLRAQQRALVGFANLTVDEKAELAGVMRGLVGGIDRTIQEMAGNLNRTVQTVYGAKTGRVFGAPAYTDDLVDLVDYVSDALAGAPMGAVAQHTLPEPQSVISAADQGRSTVVASRVEPERAIRAADQGRSGAAGQAPVISPDLTRSEIPDQQRYETALGRLGLDGWTDERLGQVLGIAQNTARKIRNAWRQIGLVESAGSEGTWKFTEREVR
jgi:hypothetical protein